MDLAPEAFQAIMGQARQLFHQTLCRNGLDLNWTPKDKPIEILEDWIEVYPGEEEDTFVLYHPDHGALHFQRDRDEDYYNEDEDDNDDSSFW